MKVTHKMEAIDVYPSALYYAFMTSNSKVLSHLTEHYYQCTRKSNFHHHW